MNLTEIIRDTVALPAAPEILPKLLKITKDPNADAGDIVSLISTDPSIVSGVLRLANSSLYTPPSPITELDEAVALLGIQEVYRIVNAVTSDALLDGELSSMEIKKGGLWTHSLAVALMMEIIAKDHSPTGGLPYTLGLLHDIGKLALHHACGESYSDIFDRVETERISINAAESEAFGFDHAEVGAKMLEEWDFPEEVFLPIRYQYAPNSAPEFKELAGALQVANWAAGAMGCNDGRDTWALEMTPSAFRIDSESLEVAIIEGKDRLESAKRALIAGAN